MNKAKTTTTAKMKNIKPTDERVVFKLTKSAVMKFRAQKMLQEAPVATFMDKVRSLGKLFPFGGTQEAQLATESSEISKEGGSEQLKFLSVIDSDSYLIGNKNHVDAFAISLLDEYMEADHLWTLKLKFPILHLLVDSRRRVIVVIAGGEISMFSYEGRRSRNAPVLFKTFKVMDEVKFIQFARDMLLAVFFQKGISFYAIDGEGSRQVSKKEFKVEKEYELNQAAQCVQGVLNIFFTGPKISKIESGQKQKQLFGLYCLPISLSTFQFGVLKHSYDVEQKIRSSFKVQTIDKECYLLNLGKQIMLFKRGYLVDGANVNFKVDNTFLKYFSDKKIVHVAPNQIDFYNVLIDLTANPPKLTLKSTDALITPDRGAEYVFMDVLRFQSNKWGFFYQVPQPNLNGEIKYEFVMTIQWDFNEKISSLLPKVKDFVGLRTDQNPEFLSFLEHIKQRYDLVSKMGVSRRDAYLWIWRESGRETVEEFKLLLDTHDYATIREQITIKLKKRMMQWGQVHKMQQGCLGMLSSSLFSQSDYSEQGFKNFLISHMLVRKLQLFKQIKLYQKQSGKIKHADLVREKDMLMINIQEYSNTIQMDVRAYLLELIYNYCKFKKDYVKEIRIILRKFKFSFRHVYLALLKEIVATAKDQLLFLLKSIPELLPYVPEDQENQLLLGVYGELKEEDWERGLTLGQVMTVFNREMVQTFSTSMWIRRNWMTYHDMIFLTRAEIESQFLKDRERVFYVFIQQLFEKNSNLQSGLLDLVNYLQDFYIQFPVHLYNNVFLYRRLYLYFMQNKFISEPFQQFLRKHDDQIFKRIFDHEKFKKGSLLKQIKPIYENLGLGDKFNYGLLKFFSSGLSEVSDIKYLLNRINNEKREFHADNEEMYEVLIKGMQIKLKLGSERDIPIEEVLIYLTKIPIKEGNVLQHEMKVLKEINQLAGVFKQMKLNMSVFEISRSRDTVLMRVISHQLQSSRIREKQGLSVQEIAKASKVYFEELSKIRQNIYGPFSDNDLLFMFLVSLLQSSSMAFCVPRLIEDNQNPSVTGGFGITQLQSIAFYCYRKKSTERPRYVESEDYLLKIVQLLPVDNNFRVFVESEVQVCRLFAAAGLDMVYPVSGQSGIITKGQIFGLMDCLSTNGLLNLDIPQLQQLVSRMQCILSADPITLFNLTERYVFCLLAKGLLKQALVQIEKLFVIDGENESSIIGLMLIFRRLSCEFVEQNKQIMLELIGKLFSRPGEILQMIQQLVSKPLSNDEQREMLIAMATNLLSSPLPLFNVQNMLFEDGVKQYLREHPERSFDFQFLLKFQLNHLLKSNDQFGKSIDFPIFHMFILQRPELLVRYVCKARYLLNVREIRCFLSFISKYEVFDQIKVLQFSKRLFKVMYDHESEMIDAETLIKETFMVPLEENVDISANLAAETENLSRYVKAIEKFKAKMKAKMSSSLMKRRKSEGGSSRYSSVEVWLGDYSKYVQDREYPFNDSDGYIEKQQMLVKVLYRQPSSKGREFDYKKYLKWLLMRTNQPIEYYLVKANQVEADEEMKKQEEALKMSFRRSPYQKTIRDLDKPLAKIFASTQKRVSESMKEVKEGAPPVQLNLPNISSIPIVPASAISEGVLWVQQVEEVNMAPTMLKEELLSSLQYPEEGKIAFKVDLLRNYGVGHQLDRVLPETLRQIYYEQRLQYSSILLLLKQIYSFFPKLTQMNQSNLQIYIKIDQLQRKLGLQLPVRTLLPFEGLLIKEKDNVVLFDFLKGKIESQLDENNVHTLSRIISLAFKKPEFQQEINNQFFKAQIRELEGVEDSSIDERMKIEKITAFAQKMSLGQLKGEALKIIEGLSSEQKRVKLVQAMVSVLREKKDVKGAEQLQSRLSVDSMRSEQ